MVEFVKGSDTYDHSVHRPGREWLQSPASEWVPTTCRMCLVGCAILVNVDNEKVINVIGNPDSPKNQGRMCAKGKSGIMNHYTPHRVTHPLKRTNPEKGKDVDPQWQEISWEEALDTVSVKLRDVCQDDPRKLYLQIWRADDLGKWLGALGSAVGSPYIHTGISGTCGKTIHSAQALTTGGFHTEPDFANCKYLINCGTQMGIATREGFNRQVPDCAKAREQGMKLVVVDPVGNNAAAKADEWLPIRPGTDAAFGLGMLNVLLNDLGIYDAEYLKNYTNAGYLVGADKEYIRDQPTGKPLLYDLADGNFKTYDDPMLKDPALEGEYQVEGEHAKPAFEHLKAGAADYPPEKVEAITTIPAKTIWRIAKEFGEAAQIGATVSIDGVEVPYRPVAMEWDRGPQGHIHAWNHSWALSLVNLVLGAVGVVGSAHATEVAHEFPRRAWPEAGKDGMLQYLGGARRGGSLGAFPGRAVTMPARFDLFELFPVSRHTRTLVPEVHKDPSKYGIDHTIEMVIHTPGNQVMGGWGDVDAVIDWYKSMDLVVGFAIEINETHELDDIVLPMPTYLENNASTGSHGDRGAGEAVAGDYVGFHQIQQRVVQPPDGVRSPVEMVMEICYRAGILDDLYLVMNRSLGLEQPYLLESEQRYSEEQILDRETKSLYGEHHNWDWFKENGVLVWKRGPEERFPGRFIQARVPIYLEHFVKAREELEAVVGEMDLEMDLSDYEPIPQWKPCETYDQLQQGEIDAIGVHYKLPYVYGAQGNANPWIDELCEKLPHSYGVLINPDLARRKGIKDGDAIWVESPVMKVKAKARVTPMVHPEVLGVSGHAGHWAKGKPLSQGKGVNFNSLLPFSFNKMDMISTALEHCAPLRVYKA